MESARFDHLTSRLFARLGRRHVVLAATGGVLARLGLSPVGKIDAKKKHKHKKRRKRKCTSAYGSKLRCAPQPCCDPGTSTIAACTDLGFPTCCESSGAAHPLGTVCCSSFFHGIDGVCTTGYPICCSELTGGGCCPASHPICNADGTCRTNAAASQQAGEQHSRDRHVVAQRGFVRI